MAPAKKKVAAGLLASLAVTAVLGGTFAQFTDRDTTAIQTLTAGTVMVNLEEGANWDTSNLILAVDDTLSRQVTAHNSGNLAIEHLVLSASVTDTPGLDATANLSEAVTVTIKRDGTVLADKVILADLNSYVLPLPDGGLQPGESIPLTFEYEVVASPEEGAATYARNDHRAGAREDFSKNPDNRFQGASLSISYTVDALQRAAVNHAAQAGLRAAPTIAEAPVMEPLLAGARTSKIIYDAEFASEGVGYVRYTPTVNQQLVIPQAEPGSASVRTISDGLLPYGSSSTTDGAFVAQLTANTPYLLRLEPSSQDRVETVKAPLAGSNDRKADAVAITPRPSGYQTTAHAFSTAGAIDNSDDTHVTGKLPSVWFKYSPTEDQIIRVESSQFSNHVFVERPDGTRISAGETQGSSGNVTTRALIPAGATAYIYISSWSQEERTFTISYSGQGEANDDIAQALTLPTVAPGESVSRAFSTVNASKTAGEPTIDGTPAVWFKYTPTQDQGLNITATGGNPNRIAVFEKTTDGYEQVFYFVGFRPAELQAGKTYYIARHGWDLSGTITFASPVQ